MLTSTIKPVLSAQALALWPFCWRSVTDDAVLFQVIKLGGGNQWVKVSYHSRSRLLRSFKSLLQSPSPDLTPLQFLVLTFFVILLFVSDVPAPAHYLWMGKGDSVVYTLYTPLSTAALSLTQRKELRIVGVDVIGAP